MKLCAFIFQIQKIWLFWKSDKIIPLCTIYPINKQTNKSIFYVV